MAARWPVHGGGLCGCNGLLRQAGGSAAGLA